MGIIANNEGQIDPEITQSFAAHIEALGVIGMYRVERLINGHQYLFDVFPDVFPPGSSGHSISSENVYRNFGDLSGKEVLDIGCGTGIESIMAAAAGASHVDAVDINPAAVECTKHNIELNGMVEKISAFQGDLFSEIHKKSYDLIIANLPIVDFDPQNIRAQIKNALYDPNLQAHRRLLKEAHKHLRPNGYVTFTHANLQSAHTDKSDKDFQILEELIASQGYVIRDNQQREKLGYTWKNYRISPIPTTTKH